MHKSVLLATSLVIAAPAWAADRFSGRHGAGSSFGGGDHRSATACAGDPGHSGDEGADRPDGAGAGTARPKPRRSNIRPPLRKGRAITISSSTDSSSSTRSRISSESTRIGTRPCGRPGFPPRKASSAATASRCSAFANRGSGRKRPGFLPESPMRRSSNSTSTAPGSMPARRRSGLAISTRNGVHSLPARPTHCSWTATSSPTCSTIGVPRVC